MNQAPEHQKTQSNTQTDNNENKISEQLAQSQLVKIVNNTNPEFRAQTNLSINNLNELLAIRSQTVLPFIDGTDILDLNHFNLSGIDFTNFAAKLGEFDFSFCCFNNIKIDKLTLLYLTRNKHKSIILDDLNINGGSLAPYELYAEALAMHVLMPFQFNNISLKGLNAAGANLTKATFIDSNLSRANFAGSNLTDTNFDGANVDQVNFTGSNITALQLAKCNNINTITADDKNSLLSDVDRLNNKETGLASKILGFFSGKNKQPIKPQPSATPILQPAASETNTEIKTKQEPILHSDSEEK
ncbi:MAG: pentapeptide repeat-containing protein [Pseudomonadota bacterium]